MRSDLALQRADRLPRRGDASDIDNPIRLIVLTQFRTENRFPLFLKLL
jgi:hypothetical protein